MQDTVAQAAQPRRPAEVKYYLYVDQQGTQHIVEHPGQVPARFRSRVRKVVMERDSTSPAAAKAGHQEGARSLEGLAQTAERLLSSHSLQPAGGLEPSAGRASAPLPTKTTKLITELSVPAAALVGGGGLVLVLALVLKPARRLLMKVSITVLVMGGLTVGYLHWLRGQAGLPDRGALETPATVIEDARRTATQLEERMRSDHALLERLQQDARIVNSE